MEYTFTVFNLNNSYIFWWLNITDRTQESKSMILKEKKNIKRDGITNFVLAMVPELAVFSLKTI